MRRACWRQSTRCTATPGATSRAQSRSAPRSGSSARCTLLHALLAYGLKPTVPSQCCRCLASLALPCIAPAAARSCLDVSRLLLNGALCTFKVRCDHTSGLFTVQTVCILP